MLKTPLWELPMLHTQMVTSPCPKTTADLWCGCEERITLLFLPSSSWSPSPGKYSLGSERNKAKQYPLVCSLCEARRQLPTCGLAGFAEPTQAHYGACHFAMPPCSSVQELLIWFGGMVGEGKCLLFFFFPQLGTSNVSFSSVILSLQSGAIMIFYYVNIKDNCKALIKANFVSSLLPSLPLPDLVRDTINLISCPKLCMH